nr:NADH dehydrogenase subunit 3 [Peloridora minuta]
MLALMYIYCMISCIIVMLMMTWTMVFKKNYKMREKNTPFECGFEPLESARLPFSTHFFLTGLLFLIFDIEIVLIMPLAMIKNYISINTLSMTSFILALILLWGLFHEWNYQSLKWAN